MIEIKKENNIIVFIDLETNEEMSVPDVNDTFLLQEDINFINKDQLSSFIKKTIQLGEETQKINKFKAHYHGKDVSILDI